MAHDRRVAGHQRPVNRQGRDRGQILGIDRVHDDVADALRDQAVQIGALAGGFGPHDVVGEQADRQFRLPLQHARKVRIGHRRQRIEALWRLGDELRADEEMALENAAREIARTRTEAGVGRARQGQQAVGDRADIAVVGRIKGRAIFEEQPSRADVEQPPCRVMRFGDRLRGGNDTGLLGDDDGRRAGEMRHQGRLGGEPAIDAECHQHGGRFHAAGEVVGNDADDGLHVLRVS